MAERLIISREAYLHIDRIIEFNDLRNQSTVYSKKFVKKLFKEFNLLTKFPNMGAPTNKDNILLLVWDDYYIYYSISENGIEIKSIYHQKENVTR